MFWVLCRPYRARVVFRILPGPSARALTLRAFSPEFSAAQPSETVSERGMHSAFRRRRALAAFGVRRAVCFVEIILPLSPKHHLSPALSPISWRRGRRTASGFFKPYSQLRFFPQSASKFLVSRPIPSPFYHPRRDLTLYGEKLTTMPP